MKKKILDTDMCIIMQTDKEYQVLILSERAGWIEHNPFPATLQGLVNALDLAMNVVSGKFWLRGLADVNNSKGTPLKLEMKNGSEKN